MIPAIVDGIVEGLRYAICFLFCLLISCSLVLASFLQIVGSFRFEFTLRVLQQKDNTFCHKRFFREPSSTEHVFFATYRKC